ncbi:MAG TPA: nitroreductase [archaeon]|nr:nitroreductase [archaeon]
MNFSRPVTDIIRERTSRRTYLNQNFKEETREWLLNLLKNHDFESPFSKFVGKIRFELLTIPEFNPEERKNLGTYGFIKGAQYFIVGAVEKSQYNREHFGYILEAIILATTDIGLGTCWLGGFFNKSLFSAKIKCASDEIVPAITPVGYSVKRKMREKITRTVIRANKRFAWEKLFFESNFNTPVSRENLGEYITLLESVRLAPSASNQQPWRVVKEFNKSIFHFYIVKSKSGMGLRYMKFRRLDIGIAVSHFDLTSKELGVEGTWIFEEPLISESDDYLYIISWEGKR